jgi:hypothetical protein
MITNPEYGKLILNRHFDSVEIRDYDKINSNPKSIIKTLNSGILVLSYDGYYSAKITYKQDYIHFNFGYEFEQHWISLTLKKSEVTNLHYEYYSNLIGRIIGFRSEIQKEIKLININDIPIDYIRDEKLKTLI